MPEQTIKDILEVQGNVRSQSAALVLSRVYTSC